MWFNYSNYRILWTLFPGLILVGCSTTIRVRPYDSFSLYQNAKVVANDRTIRVVNRAVIREDNLEITDDHTGQDVSIPLSGVEKVVVTQRGKGAWQGLGFGFLAGITLTGVTGLPATLGAGILYGPMIGAIKGRKRNYHFEPRVGRPSTPANPAPIEPEIKRVPPVSRNVSFQSSGFTNTLSKQDPKLFAPESNPDTSEIQIDDASWNKISGVPAGRVSSDPGESVDGPVVDP